MRYRLCSGEVLTPSQGSLVEAGESLHQDLFFPSQRSQLGLETRDALGGCRDLGVRALDLGGECLYLASDVRQPFELRAECRLGLRPVVLDDRQLLPDLAGAHVGFRSGPYDRVPDQHALKG